MEYDRELGPHEYGYYFSDYVNSAIEMLRAAAPAILSICIIGTRLFKDTVKMWDSRWKVPAPIVYRSNLSQITIQKNRMVSNKKKRETQDV